MAASMKDAEAAETAARASDTERAKTPAKAVAGRSRLLPFAVISITYLLFTVTDGALRMIVLLHAYNQSFSAMQVATMFTLYECAGVVTNLAAGFAGARWGIRVTLVTGLCLQLLAYGMLFGWQEEWGQGTAILYVTISQMWGGIAKDLTKLGGKTVTKLVTPEEKTSQLFKLVSLLTGWKNSLKGVGYFLGSALLGDGASSRLPFTRCALPVSRSLPHASCQGAATPSRSASCSLSSARRLSSLSPASTGSSAPRPRRTRRCGMCLTRATRTSTGSPLPPPLLPLWSVVS